ncbi:bifunctional folylpolyglutamate synthase/dihydrofolate synthase [Hazenella coriacea]|uniref:Dihydrofolate synthase/folylpolyglutamate synthase n=1 Tax=Hazenella coriacea TaxID=1179467 RepID=A0A4V2UVN7_9BACL|nr:folylpolyglutamate synthase/dihydrofolate synthase family protein [Hazenella coriacea]TCS96517.1 dihydrofolate synthase/folylpolyglutamate synthase [Hazenella coriacea]
MCQTEKFSKAEEVFHWMDEYCTQAIQPGLQRMEWMLDRLNHPERRCKFIHIAGTNGKGSTAAMVSSVLREAGYPTGLFISPYITKWNERIQFDGEAISESSFVHWANVLRPLVEEMKKTEQGAPSPFEFWTLMAICYFALETTPWFIVWETGLGGRFDSTNVVHPLVSVITQIGWDHQEWLGETLSDIAKEKAGIIKPGVPVVCGSGDEEVVQVIRREAETKKSGCYVLNQDFSVELDEVNTTMQRFHFQNIYHSLRGLEIAMMGEHQLRNAATALMTLDILRQGYATVLEPEHIYQGMKKAFWPGRMELVSQHPPIVLDGAHNKDGIQALVSTIKQLYTYDRLLLLTAMMKEKEISSMVVPLAEIADEVITTTVADQPRSLSAEELASEFRKQSSTQVHAISSAREACQWIRERATSRDLCVIAGSLYLVSEVRSLLLDEFQE